MRYLLILVVVLMMLMLVAAVYVRLAPTDAAHWHAAPDADAPGDKVSDNGIIAARRLAASPGTALSALDDIASGTPRTARIAGSVEDGMITWQTRSALFGFPDYTTAMVKQAGGGDLLVIHGRLRYGKNDLGVNARRVRGWLDRLPAGVLAPS